MFSLVLLIATGFGFFWILDSPNKGEGLSAVLERLVPAPPPQQTMSARIVQSEYPRPYLKPLLSNVFVIHLQEYSSKEGVDLLASTLPIPNKIRTVKKGDAYWACIFLESEEDAPELLNELAKYGQYGINPMLINLKSNCAGFYE